MPLLRKAFEGQLIEVQPGKREIVACISTSAVDRDGDVVLPEGLIRKNYAGLTVFYNHDTALPLGSAQWVKKSGDRVLAKYRCTDKTQFGRDMFALAQEGVLNSYSVGFLPQEFSNPTADEITRRPELKKARRIYRQWELLEFSLVGIAANPEATMLAISKKVAPETLAVLQRCAVSNGIKEPLDPCGSTDNQAHALSGVDQLPPPPCSGCLPHEEMMVAQLRNRRPLTSGEIAWHIARQLQPVDTDDIIASAFDRQAGMIR
jgi:HK97 family phage prohead protease